MRKWRSASTLVLVAALVFGLAGTASARVMGHDWSSTSGIPVNSIIGMNVRTANGDVVGTVDDVILTRQGRVKDVIVDLGGDRFAAVPMRELRFTADDQAVFSGSRADLDHVASVGYPPYRGYYDRDRGYYSGRDAFFDYDRPGFPRSPRMDYKRWLPGAPVQPPTAEYGN